MIISLCFHAVIVLIILYLLHLSSFDAFKIKALSIFPNAAFLADIKNYSQRMNLVSKLWKFPCKLANIDTRKLTILQGTLFIWLKPVLNNNHVHIHTHTHAHTHTYLHPQSVLVPSAAVYECFILATHKYRHSVWEESWLLSLIKNICCNKEKKKKRKKKEEERRRRIRQGCWASQAHVNKIPCSAVNKID